MKNSVLAFVAGIASVSAVPMVPRAVVTEMFTQVVTIEGNGNAAKAEATPPPQSYSWRWGGWRNGHSRRPSSVVTSVETPVVTVVPEPTEAASLPSSSAQQPVYSSQPASSVASSAAAAAPTGLQGAALRHHNLHRANHSSPDMVWDDQLADLAAQWASNCEMEHSMDMGGVNYGQNLASAYDSRSYAQLGAPEKWIGSAVSDQWYNGEFASYGNNWGKEGSGAGHLTQAVWAGSTKLGCAVQKCTSGGMDGYIAVCNYLPRGNIIGSYSKNVGVPKGQSTVTGSS